MPKKDFSQIAFSVVQQATGEVPKPKLNAKQEAGRKGGTIGGAARASKLTPLQRAEIARNAAAKRWEDVPKKSSEADAKELVPGKKILIVPLDPN